MSTLCLQICHKKYRSMYSLRYHMQQHTGHYQYECDVCGQKFSFKTSYEGHMNVHRGKKPFVCHQVGGVRWQKAVAKAYLATSQTFVWDFLGFFNIMGVEKKHLAVLGIAFVCPTMIKTLIK